MTETPRQFADGIEFHDHLASQWHAGYSRGIFKKRLEIFQTLLDRLVLPGQRWLDLGCGSGILTAELMRRGAVVTAADGSAAMIEIAKSVLGDAKNGNLRFLLSDARHLAQEQAGSYDGILCSSVIEYLDDPENLLAEIYRLLKDDGALIVSLPPTGSPVRLVQRGLRRFARLFGKNLYSYLEFSTFEVEPRSLVSWFRRSGFKVLNVIGFDPITDRFPLLRPSLLIVEAKQGALPAEVADPLHAQSSTLPTQRN